MIRRRRCRSGRMHAWPPPPSCRARLPIIIWRRGARSTWCRPRAPSRSTASWPRPVMAWASVTNHCCRSGPTATPRSFRWVWHGNRSAGSNSARAGAPAPWAGTCSHQTRKRGIAMGLLIKGKWVDQWYDTECSKGEFIRSQSQFRNWVTTDGRAGPTGEDGFQAEPGRYHLYVSLACPWAHRTLIFRVLKGLEKMISVSVVNPLMAEHGWTFKPDDGVVPDPIHQAEYLHQI